MLRGEFETKPKHSINNNESRVIAIKTQNTKV